MGNSPSGRGGRARGKRGLASGRGSLKKKPTEKKSIVKVDDEEDEDEEDEDELVMRNNNNTEALVTVPSDSDEEANENLSVKEKSYRAGPKSKGQRSTKKQNSDTPSRTVKTSKSTGRSNVSKSSKASTASYEKEEDEKSVISVASSSTVASKNSISKKSTSTTKSSTVSRGKSRKKNKAPQPPPPPPPKEEPKYVPLNVPENAEIEAVLKKWVGPSDRNTKEMFYLVKYAGYPEPSYDDNAQWKHPSELRHVKELVEACDVRYEEEKREKRLNTKFWKTVKEGEGDDPKSTAMNWEKVQEEAKKKAEAGEDGREQRQRKVVNYSISEPIQGKHRGGGDRKVIKAVDDDEEEDDAGPQEPEEPRGWARNLEPELIIGAHVYKDQLMYLVKWKGAQETDLVLDHDLRKKCPNLLIDFLQDGIRSQI